MNTFSEIFISIFFLFGIYCAVIETWKLALNIYRLLKKRRRIDKREKKK